MENAQPISGAAPAVAPSSTTAPRRRSGTTANQQATPTTAASSAPREYDSIRQISSSARPGQASALTAAWPERRAPSHSSGGIPSAAIRPLAFQ